MKYKALIPFHSGSFIAQQDEVLEADESQRGLFLDLEKLGWVCPIVDLKSNTAEIE